MIIVGIPPCKACKVLASRYPDIEYVELPLAGQGDERSLEVKRALSKLKINWFPCVLNDEMTETFTPLILEKKCK